MAGYRKQMEEMEESFANIRLEEEEEGGLEYGDTNEDLSEIDLRWCLVWRFLNESNIDFQAMQHKMATLWRPGRGMYVKELERNRYIFQFYHEVDITRVMEGSPWTFGRFQLVFERLKEGDNPREIAINKLDIWVQLHGMNAGFMSQRVVVDVGNYIGRFIESDANNFVGAWRDYLRVRVTISLDKPLKRRMKLKKNEMNWCWVNFKYETVPTFCFICGMIGHSEKFCDRVFDTPADQIEKPYGAWMQAEPKRKMHTMGSKWLRQGGVIPTNPQANGGEMVEKEVAKIRPVGDGDDPKKSGIGDGRMILIGKQNISSDNQGKGTQVVTAGVNSNRNVEKERNIDGEYIGLLVTYPKRRRINESRNVGPSNDINTEDEHMIESQETENANPKNLIMAGPARQARLEL